MAEYEDEQQKKSKLQEGGEEAAQRGGEKLAEKLKGGAEKGAKEAGKDTAKQAVKEGGKQGVKRGAQAATAAETAGIGPAAIEAADQAQQAVRDPRKALKKAGTAIAAVIVIMVVPVIAAVFIVVLVAVTFLAVISGAVEIGEAIPQDPPPIVGDGTGLVDNYCESVAIPPSGECSLELKTLFEQAASWAKMPAAVLAGIASIEGPQMFGYTDSEIVAYSAPGAEDPYNNPVLGDGFCNSSPANAQGPMQFLPTTWDGGGDKYHEAVNIATGEGRAENICNIKDAIYAAAWLLKCNSGGVPPAECSSGDFTSYDWDDPDRWWEGPPGPEGEADGTEGEVYRAARAYLGDCSVPGFEYCLTVWEYYLANADSGIGGAPWGWPVSGVMSQGPYEANPSHGSWSAIDIAEPTAQPVYATHDGNVFKNPDSGDGYGNYVQVFSSTYITMYAHLEAFSPCLDEQPDNTMIKAGTYLGESGWTGFVVPAGPGGRHLHYQIFDDMGSNISLEIFNSLIPQPYSKGTVVNVDYSGSECILGP